MRNAAFMTALAAILALPAAAHAQQTPGHTQVQGFGGMTVGTSTFGSAVTPTFGGNVAVDLTPNIQAIGEAGRLNDIKSPLFDLLELTDFGVRVRAWYGEAGVRLIASPRSTVRPYSDATLGFARLNAGVTGLSGTTGAIVNAGLDLINSTRPMLGVGAGVQIGRGPIALDLGYRYKQISPGNTVASLLNANKPYRINQVRVGIGVRF
jgi:opacity protein-like surface antigen